MESVRNISQYKAVYYFYPGDNISGKYFKLHRVVVWHQPARVQEAFGQYFQTCGLILCGLVWNQALDSMILVGAF